MDNYHLNNCLQIKLVGFAELVQAFLTSSEVKIQRQQAQSLLLKTLVAATKDKNNIPTFQDLLKISKSLKVVVSQQAIEGLEIDRSVIEYVDGQAYINLEHLFSQQELLALIRLWRLDPDLSWSKNPFTWDNWERYLNTHLKSQSLSDLLADPRSLMGSYYDELNIQANFDQLANQEGNQGLKTLYADVVAIDGHANCSNVSQIDTLNTNPVVSTDLNASIKNTPTLESKVPCSQDMPTSLSAQSSIPGSFTSPTNNQDNNPTFKNTQEHLFIFENSKDSNFLYLDIRKFAFWQELLNPNYWHLNQLVELFSATVDNIYVDEQKVTGALALKSLLSTLNISEEALALMTHSLHLDLVDHITHYQVNPSNFLVKGSLTQEFLVNYGEIGYYQQLIEAGVELLYRITHFLVQNWAVQQSSIYKRVLIVDAGVELTKGWKERLDAFLYWSTKSGQQYSVLSLDWYASDVVKRAKQRPWPSLASIEQEFEINNDALVQIVFNQGKAREVISYNQELLEDWIHHPQHADLSMVVGATVNKDKFRSAAYLLNLECFSNSELYQHANDADESSKQNHKNQQTFSVNHEYIQKNFADSINVQKALQFARNHHASFGELYVQDLISDKQQDLLTTLKYLWFKAGNILTSKVGQFLFVGQFNALSLVLFPKIIKYQPVVSLVDVRDSSVLTGEHFDLSQSIAQQELKQKIHSLIAQEPDNKEQTVNIDSLDKTNVSFTGFDDSNQNLNTGSGLQSKLEQSKLEQNQDNLNQDNSNQDNSSINTRSKTVNTSDDLGDFIKHIVGQNWLLQQKQQLFNNSVQANSNKYFLENTGYHAYMLANPEQQALAKEQVYNSAVNWQLVNWHASNTDKQNQLQESLEPLTHLVQSVLQRTVLQRTPNQDFKSSISNLASLGILQMDNSYLTQESKLLRQAKITCHSNNASLLGKSHVDLANSSSLLYLTTDKLNSIDLDIIDSSENTKYANYGKELVQKLKTIDSLAQGFDYQQLKQKQAIKQRIHNLDDVTDLDVTDLQDREVNNREVNKSGEVNSSSSFFDDTTHPNKTSTSQLTNSKKDPQSQRSTKSSLNLEQFNPNINSNTSSNINSNKSKSQEKNKAQATQDSLEVNTTTNNSVKSSAKRVINKSSIKSSIKNTVVDDSSLSSKIRDQEQLGLEDFNDVDLEDLNQLEANFSFNIQNTEPTAQTFNSNRLNSNRLSSNNEYAHEQTLEVQAIDIENTNNISLDQRTISAKALFVQVLEDSSIKDTDYVLVSDAWIEHTPALYTDLAKFMVNKDSPLLFVDGYKHSSLQGALSKPSFMSSSVGNKSYLSIDAKNAFNLIEYFEEQPDHLHYYATLDSVSVKYAINFLDHTKQISKSESEQLQHFLKVCQKLGEENPTVSLPKFIFLPHDIWMALKSQQRKFLTDTNRITRLQALDNGLLPLEVEVTEYVRKYLDQEKAKRPADHVCIDPGFKLELTPAAWDNLSIDSVEHQRQLARNHGVRIQTIGKRIYYHSIFCYYAVRILNEELAYQKALQEFDVEIIRPALKDRYWHYLDYQQLCVVPTAQAIAQVYQDRQQQLDKLFADREDLDRSQFYSVENKPLIGDMLFDLESSFFPFKAVTRPYIPFLLTAIHSLPHQDYQNNVAKLEAYLENKQDNLQESIQEPTQEQLEVSAQDIESESELAQLGQNLEGLAQKVTGQDDKQSNPVNNSQANIQSKLDNLTLCYQWFLARQMQIDEAIKSELALSTGWLPAIVNAQLFTQAQDSKKAQLEIDHQRLNHQVNMFYQQFKQYLAGVDSCDGYYLVPPQLVSKFIAKNHSPHCFLIQKSLLKTTAIIWLQACWRLTDLIQLVQIKPQVLAKLNSQLTELVFTDHVSQQKLQAILSEVEQQAYSLEQVKVAYLKQQRNRVVSNIDFFVKEQRPLWSEVDRYLVQENNSQYAYEKDILRHWQSNQLALEDDHSHLSAQAQEFSQAVEQALNQQLYEQFKNSYLAAFSYLSPQAFIVNQQLKLLDELAKYDLLSMDVAQKIKSQAHSSEQKKVVGQQPYSKFTINSLKLDKDKLKTVYSFNFSQDAEQNFAQMQRQQLTKAMLQAQNVAWQSEFTDNLANLDNQWTDYKSLPNLLGRVTKVDKSYIEDNGNLSHQSWVTNSGVKLHMLESPIHSPHKLKNLKPWELDQNKFYVNQLRKSYRAWAVLFTAPKRLALDNVGKQVFNLVKTQINFSFQQELYSNADICSTSTRNTSSHNTNTYNNSNKLKSKKLAQANLEQYKSLVELNLKSMVKKSGIINNKEKLALLASSKKHSLTSTVDFEELLEQISQQGQQVQAESHAKVQSKSWLSRFKRNRVKMLDSTGSQEPRKKVKNKRSFKFAPTQSWHPSHDLEQSIELVNEYSFESFKQLYAQQKVVHHKSVLVAINRKLPAKSVDKHAKPAPVFSQFKVSDYVPTKFIPKKLSWWQKLLVWLGVIKDPNIELEKKLARVKAQQQAYRAQKLSASGKVLESLYSNQELISLGKSNAHKIASNKVNLEFNDQSNYELTTNYKLDASVKDKFQQSQFKLTTNKGIITQDDGSITHDSLDDIQNTGLSNLHQDTAQQSSSTKAVPNAITQSIQTVKLANEQEKGFGNVWEYFAARLAPGLLSHRVSSNSKVRALLQERDIISDPKLSSLIYSTFELTTNKPITQYEQLVRDFNDIKEKLLQAKRAVSSVWFCSFGSQALQSKVSIISQEVTGDKRAPVQPLIEQLRASVLWCKTTARQDWLHYQHELAKSQKKWDAQDATRFPLSPIQLSFGGKDLDAQVARSHYSMSDHKLYRYLAKSASSKDSTANKYPYLPRLSDLKVKVINLDTHFDRWQKMLEQFDNAQVASIQRIEGVWAFNLSKNILAKNFNELDFNNKYYQAVGMREMGKALSHRKALLISLYDQTIRDDEFVLICEDNLEFSPMWMIMLERLLWMLADQQVDIINLSTPDISHQPLYLYDLLNQGIAVFGANVSIKNHSVNSYTTSHMQLHNRNSSCYLIRKSAIRQAVEQGHFDRLSSLPVMQPDFFGVKNSRIRWSTPAIAQRALN